MGFFFAWLNVKVLEFGNWLVDVIDNAFPGMGEAIVDVITQTRGWGEILVGYAIKFGTVLKDGIMFVWDKVTKLIAMLPKEAFNPAKGLGFGTGNVAADAVKGIGKFAGNAERVSTSPVIQRDVGQEFIERGNKRLSDAANAAATGIGKFKRGADHFGVAIAKTNMELAKNKIAPALAKAEAQLNAAGWKRGFGAPDHIKERDTFGTGNWRKASASGILRGASMAGTLGNPFKSSLMGASLLGGGGAAVPEGVAPEDWAKMNGKMRNNFMDAAVARGDMVRPNGMVRAGDKKRREAFERKELMGRLGKTLETNVGDIADGIAELNQKIE
jgi:hypothetical protein